MSYEKYNKNVSFPSVNKKPKSIYGSLKTENHKKHEICNTTLRAVMQNKLYILSTLDKIY